MDHLKIGQIRPACYRMPTSTFSTFETGRRFQVNRQSNTGKLNPCPKRGLTWVVGDPRKGKCDMVFSPPGMLDRRSLLVTVSIIHSVLLLSDGLNWIFLIWRITTQHKQNYKWLFLVVFCRFSRLELWFFFPEDYNLRMGFYHLELLQQHLVTWSLIAWGIDTFA